MDFITITKKLLFENMITNKIFLVILMSLFLISRGNAIDIHKEIKNGTTYKIKEYIQSGQNIEKLDKNGRTLLDVAIEFNQYKIAELLLQNGAKINPQTLNSLMQGYNLETLNFVLTNTVIDSFLLKSYFFDAVKGNNIKLVELLASKMRNLKLSDANSKTALMYCCEKPSNLAVDICRILVEQGVNINDQDDKGNTALMFLMPSWVESVYSERLDVITLKFYEKSGGFIPDASKKAKELRKKLKEKYAINPNSDENKSKILVKIDSIYQADLKKRKSLLDYLVAIPEVDINRINNHGYSALYLAAEYSRDEDLVNKLIEHNADTSFKTESGRTVLMSVSEKSFVTSLERILKLGANTNEVDQDGKTALILTLENYDESKIGDNSLIINIYREMHKRCIALLIQYGADPTVRDKKGKNAYDYARYDFQKAILSKR